MRCCSSKTASLRSRSAPVHGGVLTRVDLLRKLAVFDEQQRIHDEGRDVLEALEDLVPGHCVVQALPIGTPNEKPCGGRLPEGGSDPPLGQPRRGRGEMGLLRYPVTLPLEAPLDLRQKGVPTVPVERPALRKNDERAGSRLDCVGEPPRVT